MLNLQLRVVNDNGTVNSATSRVLPTAEIVYTSAINTPSGLTFKVSRDDFVPAQFPFVVRVEKSVNGGAYAPTPQNSLFVVEKDSDDSKDVGKIVTYEAVGFVTWLLQGALHNWSTSAKNNARTWYEGNKGAASAGYTLHGMLTESKNAGWFPMLNWSFNGTRDSGGNNWVAADKTVTAWELSLNLSTILEQMTDDGLCEWTTSGTTLQLYRMGKMGVDLPDTVVGGRGFTSVPVRTDATGLYSHIRAVPDNLPWQNFSSDASIRTRFGHRSIVLSQSGINTVAASAKNAQSYIEAGKEVVREESYDWVPTADLPHPWVDFDLGDQVTAHSRGGKQLRRVVALSVNQTGRDPAEVNLRVGKFIKSRAAKLKDRLDSVAVGGIIGGSGAGMPLSPGPRNTIPAAPIGVRVTSNTGEWLEDGRALSSVTVDWDAVTAAEDGSEIDVVEYEVWSRAPYETLARDIATRDTEVTISSWASGRDRLIAVRAKSDLGDWSDFSTEFLITPTIPDSIIPKAPNNLRVVTNTGSWQPEAVSTIVVTWDKVTDSTDDKPISVATYEVLIDDAWYTVNDDTYTTTVTPGLSKTFRVRARTSLGVAGDMGDSLTVTGAVPATPVANPSTPVLTTGFGNVFADWDGLYDVPGVLGMAHVRVEARTGGGSWVNQGVLSGAGQQIVTVGNIGDSVEVRLVGYDMLNRSTGTSAVATITVQGVERSDLDQEVNDFLADLETGISDVATAAENAQTVAQTAQDEADAAVLAANAAASAAADAGADATDALADAEAARLAAVAAQSKADEAFADAAAAAIAAGNAQTAANGKNRVWYQDGQPAGTGHQVGDTWFDTNDGNRVYRWNGSWVAAQFGTNAISDTAINAAKLAANAVTEGKILNGAITNDKLSTAVKDSITTAQSTADNAQTVANSAQSVASAAQTAASNAQTDAEQAISDAAAAAGIAGGKADVLIQNTAPPAAMRKATTLWIDTTGGANTPKRWVSGTTWAAVTDKAATDAAAAAATAQSAASAAHSRADDAHTIATGAQTAASAAASAASAAQTAANNAQTTANGKNKIVRSTADASSPGNYVAGDQWWKYNGSQITAMWIHSGSAWVSQTLTDSVITNLNAGTITAGTISAARLSATNIKSVLINAGAIQTANIAAGAITAASGIIADLAIGTAKIIDGSITTAKIKELAVTNAEIANGTIQHAKIGSVDASKISVGTLDAARIGAKSIRADKLLISTPDNLIPNGSGEDGGAIGWATGLGWDTTDKPSGLPGSFTIAKGLGGGTKSFANVGYTAIEANTEYLFEIWMKADVPNSLFYLSFHAQDNTDQTPRFVTTGLPGTGVTALPYGVTYPVAGVILPTVWTKYRGVVKTGPTVTGFRLAAYWPNHANGTEKNAEIKLAGLRLSKRRGGELIVDGTIHANKLDVEEIWGSEAWLDVLRAGVIEVDMVTPNFGDNLNLMANGEIILQAGRSDDLASSMGDLTTTVQGDDPNTPGGLIAAVAGAQADATQAIGDAETADKKAGDAETLAEQADGKASKLATRVVVTTDGLELQAESGQHKLVQSPTGIAVMQGVTEISSWKGSQFSADHIVIRESAQIAAHKAVKSGSRTTWRPV